MIAIASENGSLLKTIPILDGNSLGFHRLFGFVSESAASDRLQNRKAHGLKSQAAEWLCRFQLLTPKEGEWTVKALEGCKTERIAPREWKLSTAFGEFQLREEATLDPMRLAEGVEAKDNSAKYGILVALLLLLLFWAIPEGQKVAVVVPEFQEPVAVKVIKEKQKTVVMPKNEAMPIPDVMKPVMKKNAGGAAVAQNLGFLSLLGKKNLTKALGGMPTELKDASAGAGAGKEGSGGELLVGLGQGVKRTTVGNSRVSGLGGIGNKGAGGGAGGYGTGLVGSGDGRGIGLGNGRAISAIPLSSDVVLEGGLDRAVIQATIAKYLSQVRACYEEGLRKNPGLSGTVSMNFEISGSGSLNYARVGKSSLGDAAVEGCIAQRMMGWLFPKPLGGVNVKVSYPFLLRPVNS